MPQAANSTEAVDRSGIRAAIDSWLAATGRKDAAAVLEPLASDCVMYTLAPPLVAPMANGLAELEAWFGTWDGPIDLTMDDVAVETSGDIAYAHGLTHMRGTKVGDGPVDLWFRQTIGLRRQNGRWIVVHSHESVPFYMDGSDRAALDLRP